MSKELIVKHNKLIEANYKLTLQEQKLILTLAREITKEDNNFKKCVFTVEQLSEILDLEKKGYYSELKEITKSLISRVIQIKEPDGLLQVSWLNSAKYYDNKGIVELSFSNDLKPYLLQLGEHFTKLEFSQIVALNSIYAIRIYELCKQYEKIKERMIELEELKRILGIEKEKAYKLYGNIKLKILSVAEKEINEKTDISIKFEELKTGRKVTAVKFLISSKEKQNNIEKEKEIEIIEEKEYSGAVRELFELLPEKEQIENRKNELEKLLKEHSVEMLKADIEYTKNKAKTDFWAYFLKSIKSGHYSSADLEKKKIAEEKKKLRAELEEKEKKEQEKTNEEKEKIAIEKYKKMTKEDIEKYQKEFNKLAENIKKIAFQNSFEVFVISKLKME